MGVNIVGRLALSAPQNEARLGWPRETLILTSTQDHPRHDVARRDSMLQEVH